MGYYNSGTLTLENGNNKVTFLFNGEMRKYLSQKCNESRHSFFMYSIVS